MVRKNVHLGFYDAVRLAIGTNDLEIEGVSGGSEYVDILFSGVRSAVAARKMGDGGFDDAFENEVVHWNGKPNT